MKKEMQFRPWPFLGLVFLKIDSEGWWHTGKNGHRHYLHFAIESSTFEKFRTWTLIFLWMRIALCRLKPEYAGREAAQKYANEKLKGGAS